jgi:4-aminobutyrate aminotransferase-like enzyme
MLDIVKDKRSKTPDPAMAERIRYNAVQERAIFICVKNFIRFCPPLIITEAELDEAVGRLERAIQCAERGEPKDLDFSSSSSLAAAVP